MKITKEYLKRIIKEELGRALEEGENHTEATLYDIVTALLKNNPEKVMKIMQDPRAEGKINAKFHLVPTDSTKQMLNLVDPETNEALAQFKASDLQGGMVKIY